MTSFRWLAVIGLGCAIGVGCAGDSSDPDSGVPVPTDAGTTIDSGVHPDGGVPDSGVRDGGVHDGGDDSDAGPVAAARRGVFVTSGGGVMESGTHRLQIFVGGAAAQGTATGSALHLELGPGAGP